MKVQICAIADGAREGQDERQIVVFGKAEYDQSVNRFCGWGRALRGSVIL